METVLLAHTYYKQRGGEDQLFEAECALLEERGHRVIRFCLNNADIEKFSLVGMARVSLWNPYSAAQLARLVDETRPQVVHFHNTFPLMSPSVYGAARSKGAAVVQTIHNFRLSCIQGFFLRDGAICEKCLPHSFPFSGVRYACYRKSRAASVVAGTVSAFQRRPRHAPDLYIALTQFMRDRLIVGGLPQAQIVVKPNFLARDPGVGKGGGQYALFSGRLSPEKGVEFLVAAWQEHRLPLPLLIAGAGPLSTIVTTAAEGSPQIVPVGFLEHERLLELIGDATLMIVPSIGLEGFGLSVIEAFAKGTPVLASRLGAFPDMIEEGVNGGLFRRGDADDLAANVLAMISGQDVSTSMRKAARAAYEHLYSAERNYLALVGIYEAALDQAARKRRVRPGFGS